MKETKVKRFYYNKLYYDFIFNFDKVSDYYFYDFHKERAFKERAGSILSFYDTRLRTGIAEILLETNRGLGCSDEVIKNIEKIRDEGTFVVIGGQQPGFLTGPVFLIYKILSIIKLSEYTSSHLGLNTVPVFWNASDDSNFSQINNLFLLDSDIREIKLELPDDYAMLAGKRFSDIDLPGELFEEKLQELAQKLQKTDFSTSIIDFLAGSVCSAKGHGESSGQMINPAKLFSLIISKLFSKYGLIVLEPSHPGLKRLLADTAILDLRKSGEIREAVRKAGANLQKHGYHGQLSLEDNSLDFFMTKIGTRHKVLKDGERTFILRGKNYDKKELEEMICKDFRALTPNVILRPVFQDTILPVLATVCGPGEISYFAQLKDVYSLAGIKTGVIYPRFSGTMIEKSVARYMQKAKVSFEKLGEEKQEVIGRIISEGKGAGIDELVLDFKNDISFKLSELKKRVLSNNIDAGSSFDRIERNLEKEISVLRKKIFSRLKSDNMLLVSNIDKVYFNIFPEGSLQERIVNVFYFINKYDFYLLDLIYDNIDPENSSHRFMVFDDL